MTDLIAPNTTRIPIRPVLLDPIKLHVGRMRTTDNVPFGGPIKDPRSEQAEAIRDTLTIRKRPAYSAEAVEALRERGRAFRSSVA